MALNANATGLAAGQIRTDETEADKRFAIITYEGAQYFYSPVNKQYLLYNGSFVSHLGSPISFDDTHADGIYKFMISTQNENGGTLYFNNNGYNSLTGIEICGWDTPDDGNRWLIEPVDDFDPTEALALAAAQTFTVTYNVTFDGNVVATATEEVANGSALPPVPASLSNKFITLTKTGTHPTTVTEDIAVTYNATWKGPFEFTKTEESAKWYNLKIRGVWFVSKQDTEPYKPEYSINEDKRAMPAYQWAFGGDPYHVKIYNRTTGLNETLTKDGDMAVMRSGDYTWDLLPNNDGFVLRVTGTEYSCINQYGGDNGPLQFWTNSQSLTDDGSTFRVEEVIVASSSDFVINDETTSFSIEAEENGDVNFTHNFTGDWEALYLPFAIDYDAIKADFDLAEIDGVVQNDDNNDGIADITVLSIMGFKEQMTEPNTPYLIRAKNAGEQTIVFDDVTVYPTEAATFECSSFSKRYEFTGSYNTLDASALANRYVVQDGELVKGASSLAPCRWYMTATSKTGGALNLPNRIRIMPVEDVIDGIETLSDSPLKGEDIYNLAGQRLQKMQKGINIMNGKKILR